VAIYHLSVKIVEREKGRSSVAAAAYRAGQSLHEERTGLTHDFTRKEGVEHSEILAPEGAPDWIYDRAVLWNTVERIERRRDAQLAREVELGLPIELDDASQLSLLREYVKRDFVARGMVADFSIHRDDPNNPHAHVLLSMRDLTPSGFGLKQRSWNQRSALMGWRRDWEQVTNEHLAQAGLAIRIDHRTLKAQGLSLTPGRKIGVGRERQKSLGLPGHVADRVAEQREIAQENGLKILQNPALALQSITHGQATFSRQDIARFLHTRTEGAEQFQAAYLKVTTSPELVSLGVDDRNQERFTSREMLELERRLLSNAERLSNRLGHAVSTSRKAEVLKREAMSEEQRRAFEHLVGAGDLKALVGVAGSGKSRLLAVAREAWEAEGFTVKGAAFSGIATDNLAAASGIQSRTLASFEHAWAGGRDPLTPRDVLVIDETGMVGTQRLAKFLEVAKAARAKVVLVGDPEQLQAIEAGAPFRAILGNRGMAELQEVRRQVHDWQRGATQQLATGATSQALAAYEQQGAVIQVPTREAARHALLARWAREGELEPTGSRLMLAYTRDDVQELNRLAHTLRQQRGELGHTETIATERGSHDFAVGDRIYFLRNEKSLGVRNGSLGTLETIKDGLLQIKLDGKERSVSVDTRFYKDLDFGYAATVYKAQGSTVDRTYLLATPHYDRHATYVALSRHRESATVFYGAEDFGARPGADIDRDQVRERFLEVLSRARPKELVHDYLDRGTAAELVGSKADPAHRTDIGNMGLDDIEERRQRAAQRWADKQRSRAAGLESGTGHEHSQGLDQQLGVESPQPKPHERRQDHSQGGPEEDFGL
jgi:Ti-type conjugative transfer relaxase TraA